MLYQLSYLAWYGGDASASIRPLAGHQFLEALQAYTEFVLHRMNSVSANTAREKVEALLRAFLPGESALKRPAGCLIARSCAEAAEPSDARHRDRPVPGDPPGEGAHDRLRH